MKTILFIDEEEAELWDSFKRYDFLLAEFEKAGFFSVCRWHREADCVARAVPELAGLLGEGDEWRAVIVTDLREPKSVMRHDRHFENPFDFPENYDDGPSEAYRESPEPIVRLTQMLGGLPEKTFIHWSDPARGDGEGEVNRFSVEYAVGNDMYDVIARYRLGLPKPQKIVCVSPYDDDPAFTHMRHREMYLAEREARDPSGQSVDPGGPVPSFSALPTGGLGFWQRNSYPASARFVLCERMAPAEATALDEPQPSELLPRKSRDEWFRFWMSTLTLLSGMADVDELQAYSVYRLDVTIDESLLVNLFAEKRAEWMAALAAIDARYEFDLDRLKTSEYDMATLPNTTTTIPVSFDLVNRTALYADVGEVGLFKDRPRDDRMVWRTQRRSVEENIKELLRAPRRALRNAAARFRDEGPLPKEELEYCILNEYQKDQLWDKLEEQELKLAGNGIIPVFEYAERSEDFGKEDQELYRQIELRATLSKAAVVFCVVIASIVVGFIPFVFGYGGHYDVSPWAILATVVCCAVVALVGLLTLRSMQERLRRAYGHFNDTVMQMLRNLNTEARNLMDRLSDYAMFRKDWSIYDRQRHLEVPTEERLRLREFRAKLNRRIDYLDELVAECEIEARRLPVDRHQPWEMVLRQLRSDSFYSFHAVDPELLRRSRRGGGRPFTPYRFITAVSFTKLKVE